MRAITFEQQHRINLSALPMYDLKKLQVMWRGDEWLTQEILHRTQYGRPTQVHEILATQAAGCRRCGLPMPDYSVSLQPDFVPATLDPSPYVPRYTVASFHRSCWEDIERQQREVDEMRERLEPAEFAEWAMSRRATP